MGTVVAVFGLVFLAGCVSRDYEGQAEVAVLETWTQPGWMVEVLAEREEYGTKLLDCYKSHGAYGARMDFGRVSFFTPSTGDAELDEAQGEINKNALEVCNSEFPAPEPDYDSAELEYGKYLDVYNCFRFNDVEIGPMVSKDRWIEAFNDRVKGDPLGVEFDPYSIISDIQSPYEVNDPELLLDLQTECISPDWSVVIAGNWS